MTPRLAVKAGDSPDDVYAAVLDWAAEQGLELYPHQDEAILELLAGRTSCWPRRPVRGSRWWPWRRTRPPWPTTG